MREIGTRTCWVKPYTVTTHSEDFSDKLKNILKRDFSLKSPNAVWCTDITYIHTKKGFIYLSCIMDLFSRKIVSWELAPTLETKYVVSAVNKAISTTGKKPAVIHTDRGTQYTSVSYYDETTGILTSYSSKVTHGIMPVLNLSTLLLKKSDLIYSVSRILIMHIDWYSNTSVPFITHGRYTVSVDIIHLKKAA